MPTVIGLLHPPSPNERYFVALANQHYLMPSGCRLPIARCSLQRHMHAALRGLAGTRVFAGFTGQAREHSCFVGSIRLWPDCLKVSPTCTLVDVLASSAEKLIARRISSARLGAASWYRRRSVRELQGQGAFGAYPSCPQLQMQVSPRDELDSRLEG